MIRPFCDIQNNQGWNKFYQLRSKAKPDLIHYLDKNHNKNTVAWTQFSIFQKE